jgi:serine/threonine protein kinase
MPATRSCLKCGARFSVAALEGLCPDCVGRLFFTREPSANEVAAGAGFINGGRLRYFGDYELLEEIARGGMGVVYRARQLTLNRVVAVKMILAGQLASAADVQRFHVEAEAAANLHHPNIVAIYEIGEHQGQHYFSMEYVAGKSLAELCHNRPLPARRAAGYLKVIAEAVAHAHSQGLLHRDLKPSNILIDGSDQPRITDFGLAKRLNDSGPAASNLPLTLTGQVLGTPNFIPPEQATARRGKVGPRSDVYSLGAVLYYLVTGKAPHEGETVHETVARVLNSEPASPRSVNRSVPRKLETICLKCLEKEPGRRYASAQELAQDLDRFLRDESIHARPAGNYEKVMRVYRQHRLVASLSGGLVLLPIMAAVVVHYAGQPAFPMPGSNTAPIAKLPYPSANGLAGVIKGKIYVTIPDTGRANTYPKYLLVYDPTANSWKSLADSLVSHRGAAGGVLDGKLYVAGGSDGLNGPSKVLEAYDPEAARWTIKAPMPTGRQGGAGVVLNNRLYVIGGDDRATRFSVVESYDPRTDKWASEEPLLSLRTGCGAAVIDGRIYVIGGTTNDTPNGARTTEVWQPGGKWSTLEYSLPVPVGHPFVVAHAGTIYVAGGVAQGVVDDLQPLEIDRTFWGSDRRMPEPRYSGCGAVELNGEIYFLGGWDDLPRSRVPHADVFVYDPTHNWWHR